MRSQTDEDQGETYWTTVLDAKYLSCIDASPKELASASGESHGRDVACVAHT